MKTKAVYHGLFVKLFLAGTSCLAAGPRPTPDKSPQSDAFFKNGIIQRVRIQLEPKALARLRQDSRRYVEATVTVGDSVYREVGLHLKGGLASFQPLDGKPGLTLKFNKFASGQEFHGMDKIHLNNSAQDPTFMTELICGELFREAGIPAARVTHARVQLNGRDLGFYLLVEGFDKPFLRRHFGAAEGNLYDGGERTDVMGALKKISGQGPDDRSDLKALAAAAGEPASKRLARLEHFLDLERFQSFLALEVLMAHWDGYAMGQNNYKLYHDPVSNRFVFLPHGMDQMFQRPRGSILPTSAGLVAWAVLNTPEGRQSHWELCATFCTNLFSLDRISNRIEALEQRLGPALTEISPRMAEAHQQAVQVLRQNVAARGSFLQSELTGPPLNTLEFDSKGVARLTNWVANLNGGDAYFSELVEPRPILQIRSVGEHVPFVASWRTRVQLPPGHYRFQGSVRTSGFRPLKKEAGGGVCFHISDYSVSPAPLPFTGDADWQPLEAEFVVSLKPQHVELVCEARAFKGTIWIQKASMQIIKLGQSSR